MKAMLLHSVSELSKNRVPLLISEIPKPVPRSGEVLIRISVCGVCHTELDEIEGRTPPPRFPVVPGHQVVGRIEAVGDGVTTHSIGDRVGVGWIFASCGNCTYCRSGYDNLCEHFTATGRDVNGGYAEYMTVPELYAFDIPEIFTDSESAPLLCAGAIGYRSLRLCNHADGQNIGLTGFGASAHLVLKMIRFLYPSSKIFVFARSEAERSFARELGAAWVGESGESCPELLQSCIDTTPVWAPVLHALQNLAPGGRLVVNAIRKQNDDKSKLLELDYPSHLWKEKEVKSVANISRNDLRDFLQVASRMNMKPEVQEYTLEEANTALLDLKEKYVRGAKILRISKGG